MRNAKLNIKRAAQGLDGMNLEYTLGLEGLETLYLPEEELKNSSQNTIVRIDCVGGKIRAYINVVHGIRPNNIKPFSITDNIKLELIRNRVIDFMREYLQKSLNGQYSDEFIYNLKVTALECNITLPCCGKATSSDVIHLLDMSLDRTIIFRKRKQSSKCEKSNTGVQYMKPKEYRLKIYDKSDEQRKKGNPLVKNNLLRIECVFVDRSLNRMYGKKRTLDNILSAEALDILYKEYRRVLTEDIINTYVRSYLNSCRDTLLESLYTCNSGHEISDTVMKYRDLIVDSEVLRVSLRRWYKERGMPDSSRQVLYQYKRKNIGLPEGVLKTIKAFHTSAG